MLGIMEKLRKQHKAAYISMWILIVLYLGALFAGFFSPYHYANENRETPYAPPTQIHFIKEGHITWPFVYEYDLRLNKYHKRIYEEDKSKAYPINFIYRSDKYKLLGLFETNIHLFGVNSPVRIYLLGADSRGRDLFTRILYGARFSLSIGLVGAAISWILGMLIGGISGYYGGKVDDILMRVCEMVMMVPSFYLILALRAAFPPNLSSIQIYLLLVVILSFVGWAGMAWVIRGMTLSLRNREYVLISRSQGLGNLKIIIRHILPHTFSYSIVAVTLSIPTYILGESGLSFIGLGIQDPHASWGNLLSAAMGIAQIRLHPWILIPGFFIFITVMSFNLLGEGLRDIVDPHKEMIP